MRGGDLTQSLLDVARHALGIAADVEMRALVEPGPEIRASLAHPVLYINFLRTVA
ncbi:MAG: hypothetical protein JWL62_1369 [Hyphomicrobiales bacterium]|nr:hypothetical protein [Hyphomicrobiales bacterium]